MEEKEKQRLNNDLKWAFDVYSHVEQHGKPGSPGAPGVLQRSGCLYSTQFRKRFICSASLLSQLCCFFWD